MIELGVRGSTRHRARVGMLLVLGVTSDEWIFRATPAAWRCLARNGAAVVERQRFAPLRRLDPDRRVVVGEYRWHAWDPARNASCASGGRQAVAARMRRSCDGGAWGPLPLALGARFVCLSRAFRRTRASAPLDAWLAREVHAAARGEAPPMEVAMRGGRCHNASDFGWTQIDGGVAVRDRVRLCV